MINIVYYVYVYIYIYYIHSPHPSIHTHVYQDESVDETVNDKSCMSMNISLQIHICICASGNPFVCYLYVVGYFLARTFLIIVKRIAIKTLKLVYCPFFFYYCLPHKFCFLLKLYVLLTQLKTLIKLVISSTHIYIYIYIYIPVYIYLKLKRCNIFKLLHNRLPKEMYCID